jgi:hypothetical protein
VLTVAARLWRPGDYLFVFRLLPLKLSSFWVFSSPFLISFLHRAAFDPSTGRRAPLARALALLKRGAC